MLREEQAQVKPGLQVARRSGSAVDRVMDTFSSIYTPHINDSAFEELTK